MNADLVQTSTSKEITVFKSTETTRSKASALLVVAAVAAAPLAGCYYGPYYPPPPGPYYTPQYSSGGANFDQTWSAALGAVQEAGVTVASSDRSAGLIRGAKDDIDVTVNVQRQADGSVRVTFDSRGSTKNDPDLPDRFSRAYERRMGR
jgi:hypothetical protein